MIDLRATSGLPIAFDPETLEVQFHEGLPAVEDGRRTMEAIRPVLLDPTASGPELLYRMFRDVAWPQDRALEEKHHLRYDISVFGAQRLGPEFLKSSGHYHPLVPGFDVSYPELYEILHGRVIYLLQKADDIRKGPADIEIEDVIVVEAEAGDKVIMPPNYGHITINPGPEVLVTSNWVCSDFSSYYESVEAARGGAYYCVADDQGRPAFVPNKEYPNVPPYRRMKARDVPEWGLVAGQPAYPAFVDGPERFGFLARPQYFPDMLGRALGPA
jgi:glucose-6-phosphate isomerase